MSRHSATCINSSDPHDDFIYAEILFLESQCVEFTKQQIYPLEIGEVVFIYRALHQAEILGPATSLNISLFFTDPVL